MDDQVARIISKGPTSLTEAEAQWYITEAELEFSKPARTAFLLGVMFAGSTARHSFKKTELYAEVREASAPTQAYASSGNITKPRLDRVGSSRTTEKAAPAATEVLPATIREWARGKGYTVQERGRIPQNIQDAYHNAIQEKQQKADARRAARDAGAGAVPKATGLTAAQRRQQRLAAAPGAATRTRRAAATQVAEDSRPDSRPRGGMAATEQPSVRATRERGRTSRTTVQVGETEF